MSDDNEPNAPESRHRKKQSENVPEKTRKEIIDLCKKGYGTRRIGARVGWSRKIVRRVLREEGLLETKPPQQTKLAGFQVAIEEKVQKGLTTSRIHREIKELGYVGGRTILAEQVRVLRVKHAIATKKKKVRSGA